jgi:hypothetical protein
MTNGPRVTDDDLPQLLPPNVPQATQIGDEWIINVADLQAGDKIMVTIDGIQPQWHPEPNDKLVGFLDLVPSENNVVIDRWNIYDYPWVTAFDPATIPNGTYQATYTKTNQVGDTVLSLPHPVTIVGSNASSYPSPRFPDAVNGVLLYSKIAERNGASIQTQYRLEQDDQVTFYWEGFDGSGEPKTTYQTDPPLKVGKDDVHSGYIADTIPFDRIEPLGNGGAGLAYYEVQRKGEGTHASLKTKVEISWKDITALQLTCTQHAAKIYSQLPNLRPCNHGTVFGAPGLPVTISTTRGAVILEARSTDPTNYQTTLDGAGLARFRVASSDQTLIMVMAAAAKLPGDPPTKNVTFDDYFDGRAAGIVGYAYTTQVPNDGVTPCSIYFQVESEFKGQGVTVTIVDTNSQATIINADPDTPLTRTVKLSDDGCGVAEIVDSCEEAIHVTLSVTGQGGVIQLPTPVQFIAFP